MVAFVRFASGKISSVICFGRRTFGLFGVIVDATGCILTTRRICSGEKVLIFLFVLSGKTNRDVQERFQHGPEVITKTAREVIAAVKIKYHDFIVPPTPSTPEKIRDEQKFFPYFKNCIGALDGTHFPAVPPAKFAARFRNRKGFCSQNVLGACDFEMKFVYSLPGWEGSAHDGRVLKDAVQNSFAIPKGKYYLGDAGYALNSYTLTPYRGTRYHLREFGQGTQRPQTKEELFNLRHSSLRNVIERTYGLIKNKFPLLTRMTSYTLKEQVGLVQSAFVMHNFIRVHHDAFADVGLPNEDYIDNHYDSRRGIHEPDSMTMETFRDKIAADMWRDYLMLLAERHGEVVI